MGGYFKLHLLKSHRANFSIVLLALIALLCELTTSLYDDITFQRLSRSDYGDYVNLFNDDAAASDDYEDEDFNRLSRRRSVNGQRVEMKPLAAAADAGSPEVEMLREKTGCASEPCHNGADCYSDPIVIRGYSCRCREGFYGTFCDYDAEACISHPCLNDAKCGKDADDPKGYDCDCPIGYYGKQCQNRLADAVSEELFPVLRGDQPDGRSGRTFSYYNVKTNPVLKYLLYGLIAIAAFILIISFLCCIDIRRDDWMYRNRLLYEYGLATQLPGVSVFGVAGSLVADLILCKWLYGGHRTSFETNAPSRYSGASLPKVPPTSSESKALLTSDDHLNELYPKQLTSHHLNTLQHGSAQQPQHGDVHLARHVTIQPSVGSEHGTQRRAVHQLHAGSTSHRPAVASSQQSAKRAISAAEQRGVGVVHQSQVTSALPVAAPHS